MAEGFLVQQHQKLHVAVINGVEGLRLLAVTVTAEEAKRVCNSHREVVTRRKSSDLSWFIGYNGDEVVSIAEIDNGGGVYEVYNVPFTYTK